MESCSCQTGQRRIQVSNLILQCSQISLNAIIEITDVVSPSQFKFKTFITYITGINRRSGTTDNQGRSSSCYQQIFCFLIEPVNRESQTVIEETGIQTDIQLFRSFPLQIIVTQAIRTYSSDVGISRDKRIITGIVHGSTVCITTQGSQTTVLTPAGTQLHV